MRRPIPAWPGYVIIVLAGVGLAACLVQIAAGDAELHTWVYAGVDVVLIALAVAMLAERRRRR